MIVSKLSNQIIITSKEATRERERERERLVHKEIYIIRVPNQIEYIESVRKKKAIILSSDSLIYVPNELNIE